MKLPEVILSAFFLSVLSVVCRAQNVQENLWMPNGTVHATALSPSGDTLYIGGEFWYVGPHTGNNALLSTDSDTSDISWPKVNGSINSVMPDGSGGWFVGGKFTQADNIQCNNLVHIKNDNSIDKNFLPVVNSIVYGIYLSGKTVYVRGEFNKNSPKDTNYLTAYNIVNGSKVPWNLNLNGEVTCLAVKDSIMYVRGPFKKGK